MPLKYNMYHKVCACLVGVRDSGETKRTRWEMKRPRGGGRGLYTGKPGALLVSLQQARDGKWPRCGRRVELWQCPAISTQDACTPRIVDWLYDRTTEPLHLNLRINFNAMSRHNLTEIGQFHGQFYMR